MYFRRITASLALIIGMLSVPAMAQEERIRALQQPVWVVSGDERSAAFPGQTLGADDEVVTGERGKVILRLAEGSDVKLGNNARLGLDIGGMKDSTSAGATAAGEAGLYEATLDVIEGAFRFTTTELGKRFRRAVDIEVGSTATIGIRGTDVWGRAGPEKSFVALIEGNISITRQDGSELQLSEPLTVFEASTTSPRGSTNEVNMAAVQQLAPETELDAGQGVLVEDGTYAVHLKSFRQSADARAVRDALRRQGYAASVSDARVEGNRWHRVSVRGFASLADARAFATYAREDGLADSPWLAGS